MKKQICNGLLMIGIALMLQGCGQAEEPKESVESVESISENETEEEVIRKGSRITWNGLQMEMNLFGQEEFEVESVEKDEGLEIRVNSVSMNSTDIFYLECVDLQEDEVLQCGDNAYGRLQVYRVKFGETDDYYIDIEGYSLLGEMYAVFFYEGKSYRITLQEPGSYWEYCRQISYEERIPFLLDGEPEKTALFTYQSTDNRNSENYEDFVVGQPAEFRGSFQDEKNGNTFTFIETREWIEEERHGLFDPKGETSVDRGESFTLEITWNGEKQLTPIEAKEFKQTVQRRGFEVDDYNSDGYVDLRIIIEETKDGYELQDFYLWNPDIEDFVKVPTSEWDYTQDLREKQLSDDGDSYEYKYYFLDKGEDCYDQDNNRFYKIKLWTWNGYELYVCAEMDALFNDNEDRASYQIDYFGIDGEVTYEEGFIFEGKEREEGFKKMMDLCVEGVVQ